MTCRGGVLYQMLRELVGQRKETIPTSVIHATAATRDNLRKHSSGIGWYHSWCVVGVFFHSS